MGWMCPGRMIARLEMLRSVETASVETSMEPTAAEVHARHPSAEAATGLGNLRHDERRRQKGGDEEIWLSHFLVSSPTKPIFDDPSGGL
jgi:hypothetical protein